MNIYKVLEVLDVNFNTYISGNYRNSFQLSPLTLSNEVG